MEINGMNLRKIIALLAPFAAVGIVSAALVNLGRPGLELLTLMALYVFSPAGKTLILTAPLFGIDALAAIGIFLFIDAVEASFVIWNFNYILLVPWIGQRVKKIEKSAQAALEAREWLRRFSYFAVALFVFLPGPGTGPIIGSIIGRLLNLNKPLLLLAVILGSIGASFLIFPAAQLVNILGFKLF